MSQKLLRLKAFTPRRPPHRAWGLVLRGYALATAAFYLFLNWIAHPYRRSAPLRERQPPAGVAGLPVVSIVVPARNEEANIGRCVRSLLLQDYPADYEVIVVDDGSSDRTRAILEQLAAQPESAGRLRLLSLSAELPLRWVGKPHALHAGASQARGSWLVFTDADSYWSPSTLRLTLGEALASEIDLLSVVARAGAGRWLESAHVATRPDGHEPPVSATPCQSAVLSPGHDERSVYPVAPLRLRSHRRLCPS